MPPSDTVNVFILAHSIFVSVLSVCLPVSTVSVVCWSESTVSVVCLPVSTVSVVCWSESTVSVVCLPVSTGSIYLSVGLCLYVFWPVSTVSVCLLACVCMSVTCSVGNSKCKLRLKSNTCYCCDLYNCLSSHSSPDYHTQYYEFTGVNACWDVIHLYRLLWSSVVLNVLSLFLGIIAAAILGAYKDLNPPSKIISSPAPPPHILYNPNQHVMTYASFCPNGQALPAYPNYPALPMQMTLTPSSPSEESQPPSQPSSQTGSQEPGQSYTMTPNAPALYPGLVYGPSGFEKPPPYAC
uniref:Transmembrane protein 255B n=1 Tax=Esox lucius TaxID=8010 RepID=A0A3P8Z9Q4_ESOLU